MRIHTRRSFNEANLFLHKEAHHAIAVFPILADPVDVKKGDQLCKTVSQPSIQPDKVDPPMGS